jgi:undecaprenyl diphosphate synthase
MDGNGRWAKGRGLPRVAGHKAGADRVEGIVTACSDLGIKYLTLYAFSTENWSRAKAEVDALMELLVVFLGAKEKLFIKHNVRLATIGRTGGLPERAQKKLLATIDKFSKHTGLTLCLALNYGSRQEIVDALNKAIRAGTAEVDEESFSKLLYTGGMPDPDLIIRTSGEQRLSNFMLWQASYAEFYYAQIHWPDFDKEQLYAALRDYQSRERRFGGAIDSCINNALCD